MRRFEPLFVCRIATKRSLDFNFNPSASHRDDATRVGRRSRAKKRVENLFFVSFLFSSCSSLRRAWRHSSENQHDDAVDARDVANMPRCGDDDDDDATRRCVRRWRRWRRCDREVMEWNFCRRTRGAVGGDAVDGGADADVGWMMCATVFFKLTRWFGCARARDALCRCFRCAIRTAFDPRTHRRA